jgi:hypothetical protein
MDRRSFFKYFGVGVGAAPAVKAVVTMPDRPTVNMPTWNSPEVPRPIRFVDGQFAPHNIWDVQDGLLYDRVTFKPGELLPMRIVFFQYPVGQICGYTGRIKTLRHTNMWSAGQLNPPSQFLAQRALFAAHPRVLDADLEAISGAGVWTFQLMQKYMWRGPMLLYGPGKAGLRDVVKEFPANRNNPIATAQNPLPDSVLDTAHHSRLTGGTFIPSLCYFCLTLEFPDNRVALTPASEGGTGLDLLIAFQGADARGVQ